MLTMSNWLSIRVRQRCAQIDKCTQQHTYTHTHTNIFNWSFHSLLLLFCLAFDRNDSKPFKLSSNRILVDTCRRWWKLFDDISLFFPGHFRGFWMLVVSEQKQTTNTEQYVNWLHSIRFVTLLLLLLILNCSGFGYVRSACMDCWLLIWQQNITNATSIPNSHRRRHRRVVKDVFTFDKTSWMSRQNIGTCLRNHPNDSTMSTMHDDNDADDTAIMMWEHCGW